MPGIEVPLRRLRRVRWAVRGTLVLGVAASVAANVLHARPDPVAQLIAAWPPLALLLTVELISRVPVHRRLLAAARLAATTAIAGIAAWVSYWHMAGVAVRYGEQGASPLLLPVSVDGLVIVASVSLVELAGRIRAADAAHSAVAAVPATSFAAAVTAAARASSDHRARRTTPTGAHARQGDTTPAATVDDTVEHVRVTPTPGVAAIDDPEPVDGPEPVDPAHPVTTAAPVEAARSLGEVEPADRAELIDRQAISEPELVHDAGRVDPAATTPPADRPPAEPRAAIAYWHAKDPTLKPGDIATKVGRSRTTVRRILADLADAAGGEHAGPGANGKPTTLADSYVSH